MAGSVPAERPPESLAPDVLERFRRGEREAFLRAYETYADLVRGWTSHFCRGPFEHEEAVQEVWLQVHRMAAAYDPSRGPLRAWLRVLAVNRCKELLRARGRRPDLDPARAEAPDDDGLAAAAPSPEQNASVARLRHAVARFAAGLTEEERRVLELALVSEMSNDEVAQALGVSVRRCKYLKKKLLARALEDTDLRAALEEVRGP